MRRDKITYNLKTEKSKHRRQESGRERKKGRRAEKKNPPLLKSI